MLDNVPRPLFVLCRTETIISALSHPDSRFQKEANKKRCENVFIIIIIIIIITIIIIIITITTTTITTTTTIIITNNIIKTSTV